MLIDKDVTLSHQEDEKKEEVSATSDEIQLYK
jgi:hypothetical protein